MKRVTVSKCGSSVDEVIHSSFSSPQLTLKTHKTRQIGESVDIAGSGLRAQHNRLHLASVFDLEHRWRGRKWHSNFTVSNDNSTITLDIKSRFWFFSLGNQTHKSRSRSSRKCNTKDSSNKFEFLT